MATTTKKKGTSPQLKERISKINDQAILTATDMVDGSIKTGAQWQKLYAKSLKKSEPVIAKQINMAFDTLESLVDQYQSGTKRFKNLLNIDANTTKKVKKAARKTVKKVKADVADAAGTIQESVKKSSTKVDLTLINGIGPKMQELLNNAGISSIEDLANANVDHLKTVLSEADARYRMMDPTDWVAEAKKRVTT
ncbi:MAG: DUF4332 domain-containing protein [Bacteroidota bacterium]